MEVQTEPIRGSYAELVDAGEDIDGIFRAFGENRLDLSPLVRSWLLEQLEAIESVLVEHVTGYRTYERTAPDPEAREVEAFALSFAEDDRAVARLR